MTHRLFFASISLIKLLVLKACRLYNVLCLGASHGPYAQFMAQTAVHNKDRKIGLLRGAGIRFATWLYAFIRLLCLRAPLVTTIHQLKFFELQLNDRDRLDVMDIVSDQFWKAIYILFKQSIQGSSSFVW